MLRTAALVTTAPTAVRHGAARAPASRRKPSAAQPSNGRRPMYRMLSQWTKPETNVIRLPADHGVIGSKTSTMTVMSSALRAK